MKYILGSDNITGHEHGWLNSIKQELKNDTVEIVGVGPNAVQQASMKPSSKDKTAIFLVGGIDGGTFMDFYDGIGKYYHVKKAYFFLVYDWCKSYMTKSLNYYKTQYQFKEIKSGKSQTVPYKVNKWKGLTFNEWNQKYGEKCYANVVKDVNELIAVLNNGDSPSCK